MIKAAHHCDAYQASDQMICPTCHLGWDVNDPEPPACGKGGGQARASGGVVHTEDELNAWAQRLGQHLPRIAREVDRRQMPNRTNNQRRADDPGEFKVGTPPDKQHGRRYLDRAMSILAAKTATLHMSANPGEKKPKKE